MKCDVLNGSEIFWHSNRGLPGHRLDSGAFWVRQMGGSEEVGGIDRMAHG